MHIDHHPLISEFPEHRDSIHVLKQDSAHFARLAGEYESVDKAITRAENGEDRLGTGELDGLKHQRLSLKDQLYTMLRDHAAV
ncbi:YdcH family protein [Burkholderiaceae bacterium DAT-1]|nr:YdcH family protein [Burkholderiaceae bacterium DAT-1]